MGTAICVGFREIVGLDRGFRVSYSRAAWGPVGAGGGAVLHLLVTLMIIVNIICTSLPCCTHRTLVR